MKQLYNNIAMISALGLLAVGLAVCPSIYQHYQSQSKKPQTSKESQLEKEVTTPFTDDMPTGQPTLDPLDFKPSMQGQEVPEFIRVHKRYDHADGKVEYRWEEVPTGRPKKTREPQIKEGYHPVLRFDKKGNVVREREPVLIYEK